MVDISAELNVEMRYMHLSSRSVLSASITHGQLNSLFIFFETNNSFLTIQTNLLVVVYPICFKLLKIESLFAIYNNFYMLL